GEIVAWESPKDLSNTLQVVDEAASEASEQKAVDLGRARPFSVLQQRLGRKKVSAKMLREIPVAYLAFDVLYAGGELLFDRPLEERAQALDRLMAAKRIVIDPGGIEAGRKSNGAEIQETLAFGGEAGTGERVEPASVIRAPAFRASSPEQLDELFTAARAR